MELLYVIEGDFSVGIGSVAYPLKDGDILFIPGGALHECRAASRRGTRLFINNGLRIKKARMLLIDPASSVSQAAFAVGFRSLSTFDRLFRQYNGCSPQEYHATQSSR